MIEFEAIPTTLTSSVSKRDRYLSLCGKYALEYHTPRLKGDGPPYWLAIWNGCAPFSVPLVLRDRKNVTIYYTTRPDAEEACRKHLAEHPTEGIDQ